VGHATTRNIVDVEIFDNGHTFNHDVKHLWCTACKLRGEPQVASCHARVQPSGASHQCVLCAAGGGGGGGGDVCPSAHQGTNLALGVRPVHLSETKDEGVFAIGRGWDVVAKRVEGIPLCGRECVGCVVGHAPTQKQVALSSGTARGCNPHRIGRRTARARRGSLVVSRGWRAQTIRRQRERRRTCLVQLLVAGRCPNDLQRCVCGNAER